MDTHKGLPGFRLKLQDELEEQFSRAQTEVRGRETLLVPPSADLDNIFTLSGAEIKAQFPKRFAMYAELLRKKRSSDDEKLINIKKWLGALNSLDRYIRRHKRGSPENRTLKEGQFEVLEAIRNFLEQGHARGYVKLPTGYGKTVLFTELIEALKGLSTIVAVPTKILGRQTVEKFDRFAPGVSKGRVFGKHKEFEGDVIITTYKSLVDKTESEAFNPSDYDCLVLDEAHESMSELRMDTVTGFEDAVVIGFTATPGFSEDKHLDRFLTEEIFSKSIRDAVLEGEISPFRNIIVRVETDDSGVEIENEEESTPSEIRQAKKMKARSLAALETAQSLFPDEKGIGFCDGIAHAVETAELFTENGIRSEAVSGDTSTAELERIFRLLKNGAIRYVFSADLLIRGFDEESVSVCLNLADTYSLVNAEQRGGRVLRLDPNNPDKVAYIVDFVDEDQEFADQNDDEDDIQTRPVIFARVAGGARIDPLPGNFVPAPSGGGTRTPGTQRELPKIEGLNVVTDAEEVMYMAGIRRLRERMAADAAPAEVERTYSAGDMISMFKGLLPGATIDTVFLSRLAEHLESQDTNLANTTQVDAHGEVRYTAEMVEAIFSDIAEFPFPPNPHYISTAELVEIGATQKDLSVLERNKEGDYVKRFRVPGTVAEYGTYFDADFVEVHLDKFSGETKLRPAPAGWVELGEVAELCGVRPEFFENLGGMEKVKQKVGTSVGWFRGEDRKLEQFGSREFLEFVAEKLLPTGKAEILKKFLEE